MGPKPPVLLRLIRLAFPYRGQIILALFILSATSILTLATPFLVAFAIDNGLGLVDEAGATATEANGNMRTLLFAVALILVSAVLPGGVRVRPDVHRRAHLASGRVRSAQPHLRPLAAALVRLSRHRRDRPDHVQGDPGRRGCPLLHHLRGVALGRDHPADRRGLHADALHEHKDRPRRTRLPPVRRRLRDVHVDQAAPDLG